MVFDIAKCRLLAERGLVSSLEYGSMSMVDLVLEGGDVESDSEEVSSMYENDLGYDILAAVRGLTAGVF